MSTKAWKDQNTKGYFIRVTTASGIPGALLAMTEKTGEKDTAYIRRILMENLIRDGFMLENSIAEKSDKGE